jgi:putative oxidoreductase
MNVALWVVQVVLALLFAGAGFTKAITALPELAATLPYTADLPGVLVRLIGVSEVAGALGLVLPPLLGKYPALTPLAAGGLTTVMVLATLFHATRGEWTAMPTTVALAALAAFVAWGRTKKVPFASRIRVR